MTEQINPPTFLEQLPAELRDNANLTRFSDVGGLAKSYVELNSSFSSRTMGDMTAPSDDAGLAAVLRKLGTPADATGYTLPDTDAGKAFRDTAFKSRLTKQAAESLFADLTAANDTQQAAQSKAFEDAREKDRATLRTEWGDKAEANTESVKGAVAKAFGEESAKMFSDLGLLDQPEVAKFFLKIAPLYQEDGMFGGASGIGSEGDYKAVREQRLKMSNDPEIRKILDNPRDSRYKDTLTTYNALFDQEAELGVAQAAAAGATR